MKNLFVVGLVFVSTGKANTQLDLPIKYEETGQTYMQSPVWKGSDGSYLFRFCDWGWVVGPTVGDESNITMKTNITDKFDSPIHPSNHSSIPMGPWVYRLDVFLPWKEDPFLMQIAVPTAGIMYINLIKINFIPMMNIILGYDIVFKSPDLKTLQYKMIPLLLNGLPLYIGSDVTFLYVSVEQQWVIGTKIDSIATIFMRNLEPNPTSMVPSVSWDVKVNGEWKRDENLIGLPQKGLQIIAI